ncbi:hypothetical protein J2T57_002812 [Natronocella acetinitrilica]|uniref:Uncharacterized protein n=1 Tax=Natronocella acetinitrilica TaxID=414046 RepID=A0AAE3G5B9_9GAMM|nr:hypothetical protein [Natronocella acetinitrilica]
MDGRAKRELASDSVFNSPEDLNHEMRTVFRFQQFQWRSVIERPIGTLKPGAPSFWVAENLCRA